MCRSISRIRTVITAAMQENCRIVIVGFYNPRIFARINDENFFVRVPHLFIYLAILRLICSLYPSPCASLTQPDKQARGDKARSEQAFTNANDVEKAARNATTATTRGKLNQVERRLDFPVNKSSQSARGGLGISASESTSSKIPHRRRRHRRAPCFLIHTSERAKLSPRQIPEKTSYPATTASPRSSLFLLIFIYIYIHIYLSLILYVCRQLLFILLSTSIEVIYVCAIDSPLKCDKIEETQRTNTFFQITSLEFCLLREHKFSRYSIGIYFTS